MKFQFEMSLKEVIFSLLFLVVGVVAIYSYGLHAGFTARDAQVNELRDAYRDLSVSKRAGEEARAPGSAKKAKSNAVKPSPQELWIRLQNADKKRGAIKT